MFCYFLSLLDFRLNYKTYLIEKKLKCSLSLTFFFRHHADQRLALIWILKLGWPMRQLLAVLVAEQHQFSDSPHKWDEP